MIVANSVSCHPAQNVNSSKRNQIIRANGDEVAVISCYFTQPGGTFYFITKSNDAWNVQQELDLSQLLPGRIPFNVTFNRNWLCVTTSVFSESHERSFAIALFKRDKNTWKYHHTFENHNEASFGMSVALTDHDTLLVSIPQKSPSGAISCYDLTCTPPSPLQNILPPESVNHFHARPKFGEKLSVSGNIMLVLDEGAYYSEQEIEKYALVPNEINDGGITKEGIRYPPYKSDVIAYRWDGNQWVAEATFYDLLPHPPDGALRKKDEWNHQFLMRFGWVRQAGSLAYAGGLGYSYQFERDANDNWKCVGELPKETEGHHLVIDNVYTARWLGDRTFDVILTEQVAKSWTPLFNVSFIDAETRKKDIANVDSGLRLDIDVSGDVIAASFNYLSAYNPEDEFSRSPTWGGAAIFEFDQNRELYEVLRLETKDKTGLKVVPVRNPIITIPLPLETESVQNKPMPNTPEIMAPYLDEYLTRKEISGTKNEIFVKVIKQAHLGDTESQLMTADHYFYGIGTTLDKVEAVKWYQKAAEQGFPQAEYNLAACLLNGHGTEKNPGEAFSWFKKAAEHGNMYAQSNLGACYFNGVGTEVDQEKGVEWYQKAAEQGSAQAYFNLATCYESGCAGLKKDTVEAEKMYLEAAKRNFPAAQWKCSRFALEKGDFKEMIYWQRKSADLYYGPSQYNMGISYLRGTGVPYNTRKAYEYMEKAADNGDRAAIDWLKGN